MRHALDKLSQFRHAMLELLRTRGRQLNTRDFMSCLCGHLGALSLDRRLAAGSESHLRRATRREVTLFLDVC